MNFDQKIYSTNSSNSDNHRIQMPPNLNFRATKRLIDLDKAILLCHECAKTPFLLWHQFIKKDLTCLSRIEFNNLINGNTSLYLIHDKRNTSEQFYFFNFFNLIPFLHSKKITVKLLTKEDLDTHIIEVYAWFEVTKLLVNAHIDDDIGYPIFKKMINQYMPEKMKKYFFNTTKLSTEQLCDLANLTKRQFSYQQTKLKNLIKPTANNVLSFDNILSEARS